MNNNNNIYAHVAIINRIEQKILYNNITKWFHKTIPGKENEGTPAETIQELCDNFIDLLKRKRLNLSIPERNFRRNMCAALCTMKKHRDTHLLRNFPKDQYPSNWNKEMEYIWQEWLNERCFGNWIAFWARLPVREWEDQIPGWRQGIEDLLPTYVRREIEVMVDEGLIVEDNDGEFVDVTQYDPSADYWD